MRPNRSQGSRVLYVAGSVGEFPEDVQDWLSRPENPATSSPHLYDTLAMMARGTRPAALIVSVQCVDWSEMEFFEHVFSLCRHITLFVSGPHHQSAKIEAACRHGATRFNAEALDEALMADRCALGQVSTGGIVTGSLETRRNLETKDAIDAPPQAKERAAETFCLHGSRESLDTLDDSSEAEELDQIADTATNMRLIPIEREETSSLGDELDDEPSRHETRAGRVPVPWSPSPERPSRTPPSSPADDSPDNSGSPEASQTDPARESRPFSETHPVQLTAEEIAALLGQPPHPQNRAKGEPGT